MSRSMWWADVWCWEEWQGSCAQGAPSPSLSHVSSHPRRRALPRGESPSHLRGPVAAPCGPWGACTAAHSAARGNATSSCLSAYVAEATTGCGGGAYCPGTVVIRMGVPQSGASPGRVRLESNSEGSDFYKRLEDRRSQKTGLRDARDRLYDAACGGISAMRTRTYAVHDPQSIGGGGNRA